MRRGKRLAAGVMAASLAAAVAAYQVPAQAAGTAEKTA